MPHDQDRPSTETEKTLQPPAGENIKALVTPGDDAAEEADAEIANAGNDTPDGGEVGGADDDREPPAPEDPEEAREIERDVAHPKEADEAQSPT